MSFFYNVDQCNALLSRATSAIQVDLRKGFDLGPLLEVPEQVNFANFISSGCFGDERTPIEEYYGVAILKLAPHITWQSNNVAKDKRKLMTVGRRNSSFLFRLIGTEQQDTNNFGLTGERYLFKVDRRNKGLVRALQDLQLMTLGRVLSRVGGGITADKKKAVLVANPESAAWLIGKGLIQAKDLPTDAYRLSTMGGTHTYTTEEKKYAYLEQNFSNPLRNHSFNPLTLFNCFYLENGKALTSQKATEEHIPFLGVELETIPLFEQANAAVRAAQTWEVVSRGEQFLVAKTDGSLRNGGAELVTCPAVYEQQMVRWSDFFGQQAVYSQGAHCSGLHVHVNRASMSAMTLGKIVKLMEGRNKHGEESDILFAISGRTPNTYCEEIRDNSTGEVVGGAALQHRQKIIEHAYRNRYATINFNNANTVEFRFMKGTCNEHDFKAKLQSVQAILDFAQSHSSAAMSAGRFLEWLEDKPRAEKFPDLNLLVRCLSDKDHNSIAPFVE